MSIKIEDIIIKNFATVSHISVSFDKNLTFIVGENGAGKTTTGLNAVWFLLKGLSQRGEGVIAERFRFVGPHGKSANVIGNLRDEQEGITIKISRKLLKNSTELKIEASDGRQLDQKWLDSIFNSFLIDPTGFSRLSGKAQALEFGADTIEFDTKKKELELERREIGRDVTRLTGVVKSAGDPKRVERVSVGDLMAELERRQKSNHARDAAIKNLEMMGKAFGESAKGIETFKGAIKALEIKLERAERNLEDDKLRQENKAKEIKTMEITDTQEIKDQITEADKINQKAADYESFRENEAALEDVQLNYEGKTVAIQDNEAKRTEYLQSLKLPWPNISISDDGEFRLNEKPFRSPYFSTGEILKFGARIGSKLKDGLKYVYFPNSDLLDDKNQEEVFKVLNEEGFQVVAESVRPVSKKDIATITLREMKVVEDSDGSNL